MFTCTVEGCTNAGVEIETPDYIEAEGEQIPVGTVVCGACGTVNDLPLAQAKPAKRGGRRPRE